MAAMVDEAGKWAAARACHAKRVKGEAASVFRDRILLRACPEDLRIAVVSEFVVKHVRLPSADDEALTEWPEEALHEAEEAG